MTPESAPPKQKLLTIKEVAAFLKLNVLTVYGYIKTGQLSAVKFGRNYRVDEGDLEKFVREHRVSSKKQ